jgi:hypothetical protein
MSISMTFRDGALVRARSVPCARPLARQEGDPGMKRLAIAALSALVLAGCGSTHSAPSGALTNNAYPTSIVAEGVKACELGGAVPESRCRCIYAYEEAHTPVTTFLRQAIRTKADPTLRLADWEKAAIAAC